MIKKVLALGSHVMFIPEGKSFTSPSAGTVGREAKPDKDEENWVDMGYISAVELDPQREEKEVYAASPGQLRLVDVIEFKAGLNLTISLEEVGALVLQLAFRTLELADGGANQQYNPTEGSTVKGWIKVQQYDQADASYNTVDLFVYMRLNEALSMGDDVIRPKIFCRVLQSTLNTGTLD